MLRVLYICQTLNPKPTGAPLKGSFKGSMLRVLYMGFGGYLGDRGT